MVIQFFGKKTGFSCTSHEVLIKKGTKEIIDPVQSMKDYSSRRHSLITQGRDSPVFLTLNFPFSGLSAADVADMLNKWVKGAGLDEAGNSARSFRPTGATAYITSGIETHRTRSLRRWKSEECFNERYVYPLSSSSTSYKMLNTSPHS